MPLDYFWPKKKILFNQGFKGLDWVQQISIQFLLAEI